MSGEKDYLDVPDESVESSFGVWWDGTRRRDFLLQHCESCDGYQHYPRSLCSHCGSADPLTFVTASGRGTLYSFTDVRRPAHPDLRAPYMVGLVNLAEGPRVLTRIVGVAAGDVHCDDPVVVDWIPLHDGRALPVFTRAPRAETIFPAGTASSADRKADTP
jgi:uncharacterized OB-fold protein